MLDTPLYIQVFSKNSAVLKKLQKAISTYFFVFARHNGSMYYSEVFVVDLILSFTSNIYFFHVKLNFSAQLHYPCSFTIITTFRGFRNFDTYLEILGKSLRICVEVV